MLRWVMLAERKGFELKVRFDLACS